MYVKLESIGTSSKHMNDYNSSTSSLVHTPSITDFQSLVDDLRLDGRSVAIRRDSTRAPKLYGGSSVSEELGALTGQAPKVNDRWYMGE